MKNKEMKWKTKFMNKKETYEDLLPLFEDETFDGTGTGGAGTGAAAAVVDKDDSEDAFV